jgi:hypothetical protein
MKNVLILTIIFVFLFPLALLAQEPPLVNPQDIITQIGKAINDWSVLGWVYGSIALVGVLIMILRLPLIDNWLGDKNLKKYKPIVAGLLGGLSGFLSTYATGAKWPQSILAGIAAGLAATGVHQAITQPKDNAMPVPPKP